MLALESDSSYLKMFQIIQVVPKRFVQSIQGFAFTGNCVGVEQYEGLDTIFIDLIILQGQHIRQGLIQVATEALLLLEQNLESVQGIRNSLQLHSTEGFQTSARLLG